MIDKREITIVTGMVKILLRIEKSSGKEKKILIYSVIAIEVKNDGRPVKVGCRIKFMDMVRMKGSS